MEKRTKLKGNIGISWERPSKRKKLGNRSIF
jgi:hypothetical protein